MLNVACSIVTDKLLPVKIGQGAVLYEIIAVNVSDLQHIRNTVLAYTNPTALLLPLYNDTNDYYLFKLEHLPKRLKKLAIKIPKNHKPVFSTHDQDIGKVNCIKMDIQIDETKPRIQKYVPVPHAA